MAGEGVRHSGRHFAHYTAPIPRPGGRRERIAIVGRLTATVGAPPNAALWKHKAKSVPPPESEWPRMETRIRWPGTTAKYADCPELAVTGVVHMQQDLLCQRLISIGMHLSAFRHDAVDAAHFHAPPASRDNRTRYSESRSRDPPDWSRAVGSNTTRVRISNLSIAAITT